MKTVFIRAIEVAVDDKGAALLAAIRSNTHARFEVDVSTFSAIPGAPFSYWVSDDVRAMFRRFPPFESDTRCVRQGLATADDFRFVRTLWEPSASRVGKGETWRFFSKGGISSPYYTDFWLVVNWAWDGLEIRNFCDTKTGKIRSRPQNVSFYFQPGFTYTLRSASFGPQAMPGGTVISVRGSGIYVDSPERMFALGILSSKPFDGLLKLQLARGGHPQFDMGDIASTPFPSANASSEDRAMIAKIVGELWSNKREQAGGRETSNAFLLPAILRVSGVNLEQAAQALRATVSDAEARDSALRETIDDVCFRLFEFSPDDRAALEQSAVAASSESDDGECGNNNEDEGDETEEDATEVDAAPMVASLLSWSLGVALGRFDVRLATGERAVPPEPGPFDPLPVCSPGMLTGDDGLPVAAPPAGYPLTFPADGILVDDPGHPRDLIRAVRSVFDTVFDDANARWHEAAELLSAPDLRTWFARDFFEPHIKRYSKSRRKAPIYWQLATASGSYSVWIYIHRATGDTLFRVLNDFVGPKLDHEKAKLEGLTQEAGPNPSAAQRRQIEQQENFVGELQALKTEVARVAPLWKPNLDDGVILNFAPLWRLVPQSRSWQGECKKAWDKLVSGDYDWAHLAMHLWPERVAPQCIEDRSLAIAHRLEDVFWHGDESGTSRKSRVDDATVQKLVNERTSTTVKAALKDLLSAATPTATNGRKAKGRSASSRSAAPKPAAASRAPATIDEATLSAVKAAIASVADGASKADVLAATGLSDTDWNKAIAALLDRGDVTRTGQKRATRYHAVSQGEDG